MSRENDLSRLMMAGHYPSFTSYLKGREIVAKRKEKVTSMFSSYEEVSSALREIAEIEMQAEAIEAEVTKMVNALKEDAQAKLSPIVARKKMLEEHVQLFAEAKKPDDFKEKKSMDLIFGEIGFRTTGGGITVKSNKATVEAVLALGNNYRHLLITDHKPNKEVLEGLEDDFLKQIGCSRKKKVDSFWYTVHREKLAEAAAEAVASAQ